MDKINWIKKRVESFQRKKLTPKTKKMLFDVVVLWWSIKHFLKNANSERGSHTCGALNHLHLHLQETTSHPDKLTSPFKPFYPSGR